MSFSYLAIYHDERAEAPMNVFVIESGGTGPLRAVLRNARDETWMYAPTTVAEYAEDPRRKPTLLTRQEAEQIATEVLNGPPLPDEDVLHRMIDEGQVAYLRGDGPYRPLPNVDEGAALSSRPSADRGIVLWNRRTLLVTASLQDGKLRFSGEDIGGHPAAGEYEYALTVPAADVPRVVAALGGGPDDDVLALLLAHRETIIGTGEQTWLRSIGIDPEFWSRVG